MNSLADAGSATVRETIGARDPLSTIDNCTKCGICQSHCPVLAVTPEFPGPKYAGPQAARFRLIGTSVDHSTDLCTGCGICTSVCPNDVSISDIITIAKADSAATTGALPLGQKLLNRPDVIGGIGSLSPALTNRILASRVLRKIGEVLLGVHSTAPVPKVRGPKFRRWFEKRDQPDGPSVVYFSGCAVDHFDPETGIATVKVLNKIGYRVKTVEQGCCALPMLSSGEWFPARARATRLIEKIASAGDKGDPIVTSSTSCGLTLKTKYATLLGVSDGSARRVSSGINDVCQFLRDNGLERLLRKSGYLKARVFYHAPCQLRSHGIGFPALELLRVIPGLDVVVSSQDCCGIGGTYGYDKKKNRISMAIGKPLTERIAAAAPDTIACDSETCRWHLEAMTGIPSVHPSQIFATCLDR